MVFKRGFFGGYLVYSCMNERIYFEDDYLQRLYGGRGKGNIWSERKDLKLKI